MRNRHGPSRRAFLVGAVTVGVMLALMVPAAATAADVMRLPTMQPLFSVYPAADPVAIPIQGANRYSTAVEASKKFTSAGTVVVASGESFPDALGGAALAGAVGGPLLLTPRDAVPADVLAEIDRLGAAKVYVLGGTGAVSAAAFAQLDAAVDTVVRLGGASRYQTAQLVADEAIDVMGDGYDGGAFMATGMDFPDALAASPIMYAQGMPLVLVDASGGFTLPTEATDVTILGGTGAVPASAQAALGAKFETRIAGANRYATARLVAEYGVSLGMQWDYVGVATGANFPDALCAGPLCGSRNAVLLLTTSDTISTDALIVLGANKALISQYYLFGGPGALSDAVRDQIADVLVYVEPPVPPGNAHDVPAVGCTATECHVAIDVAALHAAVGCPCHTTGSAPTSDCSTDTCHGALVHDTTAAHTAIVSDPAAPAEGCQQDSCHGLAGVLTYHPAGCDQCHASTDPAVAAAVAGGNATCESCHDFAVVHDGGDASHALSGACYSSTCHFNDMARIHTTDFRGTGDLPPGCVCHGTGTTPISNCSLCHPNTDAKHDAAASHAGVEAGIGGELSGGCVSCHGSNLMEVADGEHRGCTCHRYLETRGATECQSCHTDPMDPEAAHPYHVGVHDAAESAMAFNSAGCASCHGDDLMAVLPEGNDVTGVSEHNGCTCHQYGLVAGQTACEDCHTEPMSPDAAHPYHVGVHDDLEAQIGAGKSAPCTACHGTYIDQVGSVSMHVADAHEGCSCHAFGIAQAGSECVDCHNNEYAPHGFVNGETHMGEGWVAASGHSTTALGKRGVYESFGFLGITDSNGAAIDTTTWPFPSVDVFWSGTEADKIPAAIGGLTKNSVVTCEDCHTGLIDYEVAGPHGSNIVANAGIDPRFPGKFEEAYLWAGPLPSGGTTVSSGIVRYLPGGANELEKEEIANWALQVYTSATTTIPGPATIVSGNDVICAKCHNLYNDGSGYLGWSNYGHEHHDTAPVNYLGLFQRASDGTTYTAMAAENASDTVLKARSVGREGAGACRNCHVAIPHGWKRPRLIVYSTDPAPYNIGPAIYEGETTSWPVSPEPDIGSGQMNGISSVIGPQRYVGASAGAISWSGSQCNGCGHHADVDLSAGYWK